MWRERGGQVEVAVVHRPRYGDWSFPKGKAKNEELPLLTAVREVAEETSTAVAPSRRIGRVRYKIDGRDKVVRYWAMHFTTGTFQANAEVDAIDWLDIEAARRRLSYDNDRSILDSIASKPLPTSVVILVRHARAGKRASWTGSDQLRPLDRNGRSQVRALLPLLNVFKPARILSAEPLRCVQTVEPVAASNGLRVQLAPACGDAHFGREPGATHACVQRLIEAGQVTVVSSQGITIPAIIDGLGPVRPRASTTAKGAAWVLGTRAGEVVSADYYPAPANLRHARRR